MTVSELMQAMADAGAPFEAIVIAVKAVEEARAAGEVKERTRSKAAEHQARYRERHKSSQSVTCDAENVTRVTPEITGDAERNADPLPLPPEDLISNPPTPAPENNTRVREDADAHVTDWLAWWDKNPFPRPRFASASLWASLKKNRKTKRLANTVAAWTKLLVDVDAYAARLRWPPGKVLEACVERGWGAIHETNEMKEILHGRGNGSGNRNDAPRNSGVRDNRDGFKRACDDWIDEAGRSATGGNGAGGQLALGGPDSL